MKTQVVSAACLIVLSPLAMAGPPASVDARIRELDDLGPTGLKMMAADLIRENESLKKTISDLKRRAAKQEKQAQAAEGAMATLKGEVSELADAKRRTQDRAEQAERELSIVEGLLTQQQKRMLEGLKTGKPQLVVGMTLDQAKAAIRPTSCTLIGEEYGRKTYKMVFQITVFAPNHDRTRGIMQTHTMAVYYLDFFGDKLEKWEKAE